MPAHARVLQQCRIKQTAPSTDQADRMMLRKAVLTRAMLLLLVIVANARKVCASG